MFLHQSNRLEDLFQHFRAVIAEPLADPLVPEIIVVQNQGMAQWVAQQLAFAGGIAAHIQFPLPARFIWDLFQRMSTAPREEDLFCKPVLRWRIAGLLPQLLALPAYSEIAAYLQDDGDGAKLCQLSERISDIFDQYAVYRPDLLSRWQQGKEQGEEEHWQAVLWRALNTGAVAHRAQLAEGFLLALNALNTQDSLNSPDSPASKGPAPHTLPQRCHLFGLNSLAPVYLELINQVSQFIEIHLFHLSPCRHYWGDLVSARQLAGLRTKALQPVTDDVAPYYEQGHPLLVSLGRIGQDFFRQLLDCDVQENDLYQDNPDGYQSDQSHQSHQSHRSHQNNQNHLLASLQADILDLHDRSASDAEPFPLEIGDQSVQFHCCFSPLREIQSLHDRLLDLFTRYPNLTPSDILVSAPNIQIYADAVAGVFGEAHQERQIPWSLADQPMTSEQPVIRCFLDLLDLVTTRFTAPSVLGLCETPALLHRFGLDPDILPRLHAWVREAGIRWGLDEAHRQELDVRGGTLHTWRFGLDRLMLGYLMGECQEPQAGLVPCGLLASTEADELGGFLTLIDTLAKWRLRLRHSRPAEDWCADLLALIEEFFDDEGEEQGCSSLRETINALRSDCRLAAYSEPISFTVLKQQMDTALGQPAASQTFLSGRVTFCNMVPMRSVPFRIICLLGMNDLDFPRCQHPLSFDLIASTPRLGDRNRRNDDRYLFLEALLSARDVFYLSWVGRNQRDDSLSSPSVVLSELRDYLDQGCLLATGTAASAHLTTTHPMQPFSRRCFDGSPATASYNPAWLPAESETKAPPFLSGPLEAPSNEWRSVDLHQLVRFWRHPVRFFLTQIIGLRLQGDEDEVEESEPFALNALEQYHLRTETINSLLAGVPEEEIQCRFEGSGRLPQDPFGAVHFAKLATTAKDFASCLQPLLTKPMPPVEIDRLIGPFRLTGWLTDLYPDGRISWRTGTLKGSNLIEVWLNHLLLNLLAPPNMGLSSFYLTREKTGEGELVHQTILSPVADPEPHLHRLLELYWQGLSRPLPFFPETSWAWAKAAESGREEDQARRVWTPSFQRIGEGAGPGYSFFFSPSELPLSPDFIELTTLFEPIISHLEDERARP